MVFLFPFSPHNNNHSIPSCKKTRKKKRGNGSFISILRLIARRFISKTKADNQENGDLQDYPLTL